MKRTRFIPLVCAIISCNPNPGNNSTKQKTQEKNVFAKISSKIKRDSAIIKSPSQLIGIWADTVGGNAIIQIDKATFFYPDNQEHYSYKIIGDSIRVHYDGYFQSFAWMFKGNDVLVLTGADGVTPFYRAKE